MMFCDNCQIECGSNAKFCFQCGGACRFENTPCPTCGHKCEEPSNFCAKCGSDSVRTKEVGDLKLKLKFNTDQYTSSFHRILELHRDKMKMRDYSPTKKQYMSGSVVINHISKTLFRIDFPDYGKLYPDEYVFELFGEQWYLLGDRCKLVSFLDKMKNYHIGVNEAYLKLKDLYTDISDNNSASQG